MIRYLVKTFKQYNLLIIFTFIAVILGTTTFSYFLNLQPLQVNLETSFQAEAVDINQGKRPIEPLSTVNFNLDENKLALGKNLFSDSRLSSNNTSCATCHNLDTAGIDNLPVSLSVNNQPLSFNSPTVFNSGLNFKQFWDGRAATLEEQIEEPINNPLEMASSWSEIIPKLESDSEYVKAFNNIYDDGIQKSNIKDAIADFERSLLTPSRFDSFLEGEETAITPQEKKGYELFQSYGCIACHQGVNVGGNMFQALGIFNDYFSQQDDVSSNDLGRFNITQQESDRYVFKVPSLRNVELTAPYFHDGHVETLIEAIKIMAEYQLGRAISKEDIESITAFLHSLNGIDLEEKLVPSPSVFSI